MGDAAATTPGDGGMPTIRREIHYGDRLVACFHPRPASVQAMLAAAVAAAPDRIALEDGELRLSYRALDARVAKLAGALRGRGVGAGDRVALVLDNRAEFVLTVLACARLNAIAVPMGTRLRAPEIGHICADSAPRVLLHEAALAGHLPAELPGIARIAVAGDPAAPGSFEALMAEGTAIETAPVADDDPFCIMYTSGTTGRPKGAVITNLAVVHSCMHWAVRLGLTPGISTVLVIPASHVAGLGGVLMPFLHIAGRVILLRAFKAADVIGLIARERIEHALLVPAMYNLCLREPGIREADLSAWRWAVYGGAPMPEPTIRGFAEVLPGLAMCNAYGATETTSPATIMPPGRGLERSDSIGTCVDCGDIRVVDEAGHEVAPGEPGELLIAGPMVVPRYWQNDEATRASFVSGYWRSGDIGSVDAEGFVRVFDRKKDMIVRGGFKVYPAEVENVLSDHPGVVEAAVVGAPDEVLGEIVVAHVQAASGGADPAAITAFCAERMADYKVPDVVLVRPDPLPRNANGKLQKDVLRREAPEPGAHRASRGG